MKRRLYSSLTSTSRARRPASFALLMNCCRLRGGYFSSSTLSALSRRLIAASWSEESRIWNEGGSAASRWCARSVRLHSPWKVPIHMPRVLMGSIADSRVSISRAALLVNVTASTPCGLTRPVWISHAMRVVSTLVLPLPAPARISEGWSGSVTAASCCSLRLSSSFMESADYTGAYNRFRLSVASGPQEFVSMRAKYVPEEVEAEAQRHWRDTDAYRARENDPRFPNGK